MLGVGLPQVATAAEDRLQRVSTSRLFGPTYVPSLSLLVPLSPTRCTVTMECTRQPSLADDEYLFRQAVHQGVMGRLSGNSPPRLDGGGCDTRGRPRELAPQWDQESGIVLAVSAVAQVPESI